jgi:opacity protein-like surface antigen
MRSSKSILYIVAVLCGFNAAPAVAADWSGFYTGVNIGSRILEADWETTEILDPTGCDCGPMVNPLRTIKTSDRDAGLFFGHDWNPAAWVVGAELGMELMENRFVIRDGLPGLAIPDISTSTADVRAKDGRSLRARGGHKLGENLLLYGTLGLATLDVEITSTCYGDGVDCAPISGSFTHSTSKKMRGETYGLGVEYQLSGSLLRAEYRLSDFGDFSFTAMPETIDTFGANAELDVKTSLFQLGIVWKL